MLTVSFPDLRPNPQDTSAFYLENIYGLLGNPNISHASIPSTLPQPPAFSPPIYAIWGNSLFFLSLAVALTGAIGATMVQQWMHRYITVIRRPWYTPEQRARVRELYLKTNQGPYVFWGIGELSLPFYIHLSIFLFLAGGFIYLLNTSHAVLFPVIWWCAIMIILYAVFTVGTIFKSDMLLCTPLSPLALHIYLRMSYAAFQICSCITPLRGLCDDIERCYRSLSNRCHEGLLDGNSKAVEEAASKHSSKIDAGVLESTLNSLNGDDAIVEFFEAISGFFSSNVVNLLPANLPARIRDKFKQVLNEFLYRTFRSNTTTESVVRCSRILISLNASRSVLGSDETSEILYGILSGRWHEVLRSVQEGHTLRNWVDTWLSSYLRGTIASIVSQIHEHDNRLAVLLNDQFGLPERILRDSITHGGDSISLAILVHIIRHLVCVDFPSGVPDILRKFPHFDTNNTHSRLQHEFCTLWDEIVREGQKRGAGSTPTLILREILHIYMALHQVTDATTAVYSHLTSDDDEILSNPFSYPSDCGIVDHRSGLSLTSPSRDVLFDDSTGGRCTTYELGAPQHFTHVAAPSLPPHQFQPLFTEPIVTATNDARQHAADISSSESRASRGPPSSSAGAPRGHNAETAINSIPYASSSSPSRIPVPTPNSTIAPTVIPSLSNVAFATQSGHLLHAHASSSQSTSLTISHPNVVALHPVSLLDPRGTDIDTLHTHDDTRDLVLREVSHHARLSEPSAPDNTEGSLQPEVNPVRTATQPQVTCVLGAHVTGSIRAASGYDNTRGMNTFIPMAVLPRSDQSAVPVPGVDSVTLPPEDCKNDRN